MRFLSLALVILCAPVASLAQPFTPTANHANFQIPVAFQVVGLTMQTYTGDMGGPLGATRACLDAYGTGARMCVSSELQGSVVLPNGFGQGGPGLDAGGTVAWLRYSSVDCENWTTNASQVAGSIGDLNGTFTTGNGLAIGKCNNAYPIMCCAPMPIPVTLPEPSASLGISTGVFALLALNAIRG